MKKLKHKHCVSCPLDKCNITAKPVSQYCSILLNKIKNNEIVKCATEAMKKKKG